MVQILDEIIEAPPPDRPREVENEAARLVEADMTLRDLRNAHALTQKSVAEALRISQDGVSRIERRGDFLLSTLRSYIEAMGGKLRLVVEFPNREPVTLADFNSLSARAEPRARSRKPTTKHAPL